VRGAGQPDGYGMKFRGITHSVICGHRTQACPECGSTSRIAHGLCPGCLLRCGLDAQQDEDSLGAALSEIQLPDTDWCVANYQILEEIGRGGMGVIYRARQIHSRRIVAVKRVLAFHSDSHETLTRFEREAQAAASLDHPNILPIYEVGRCQNGLPFFSMKFATGGSLLQALAAFRNRAREAVQLIEKVARAVEHAHQNGILHRDLKPGNVLLDVAGEPFVSDFGLAKWLDASADLTRTLTIFGTPGYIAPEQSGGSRERLTPAVDVYSLGAILFELLSGRPPFLGEHALAVIQQAADRPAPRLRSVIVRHDCDLETICERCLDRDPPARYQSAAELADDLKRWLDDRPIHARRISVPARVWRWSRRNPVIATTLALILMSGIAAAVNEFRAQRLSKQMQQRMAADHALIVVPFLDFDEIAAESEITSKITSAIGTTLSNVGPSRVALVNDITADWSGSAAPDEIRDLAQRHSARAVVTGTVRRAGTQRRIGVHVARADGANAALNRLVTIDSAGSAELLDQNFARLVYRFIGESDQKAVAPADRSPANERVRAFLVAGRDLMNRRTVAELDRAIASFESAIREDPRSIDARSFLAMACMGRDLLSSDSALAPRALKLAREAVTLSPEDPTANRSLAIVCATNGLYSEAQEYAFRSLELGDRSGRAFGQIAYIWRARGRPDKALMWYGKAKAAQHHPADFEALIGDCWSDLARDDQARAAYESSITFQPDQPEGWLGLARLKLLDGDIDRARQICRAQLLHYPDAPIAQEFSALVEFFSRNYSEAEHRYAELAGRDPLGGGKDSTYGAVDYRSAIACLKIYSGDKSGARRVLEQVVTDANRKLGIAANDAQTLYRLSAAEAMLEQPTESLRHLDAAIAAGWIDYRSAQLDPRFDRIATTPQFRTIISDLAAKVARLGRQSSAAPPATN
jgi:serine/threonine protein kinase/Flp pilus assembly protein TadD